ncbi:hypothetical protein R1sor_017909 [Riccia sorocarpa]|uniref:Nucleolar 27S pre-rRNA processing Urb2/Npa2 C-terminal domain-containing protein n=1 Tax=Riccia sorocarpa TaxID=122646 RepID=A0ABD3I8B5_9MARC
MGKCEIIGELYLAAAVVLRLEGLKLSQQEGSKSSVHLSPGGGVLLGAGYWILFQAAKQIRSGLSLLASFFDVHLYILGSLPATKRAKRLRLLANHFKEFAGAIFSLIERTAGPKLFTMKHGISSRFENDASMVESGPVLLRCIQILTSVASREVIYPLEACHVAFALHCPSVIFSLVYQSGSSRNMLLPGSLTRNGSGAKHEKEEGSSVVKIGSDVGVELYRACCRLLCSLIRHRRRESGHCIALLGDLAHVLLHCLEVTYWPLADESPKVWSTKMATYCATWLRRIYEEPCEHKETLGKYCCHMLSNYLCVLAGHGPVGKRLSLDASYAEIRFPTPDIGTVRALTAVSCIEAKLIKGSSSFIKYASQSSTLTSSVYIASCLVCLLAATFIRGLVGFVRVCLPSMCVFYNSESTSKKALLIDLGQPVPPLQLVFGCFQVSLCLVQPLQLL